MPYSVAEPPRAELAHLPLALGGFAIGTTEFATMSILPLFSRDLGVSIPTGARDQWLCNRRGHRRAAARLHRHVQLR